MNGIKTTEMFGFKSISAAVFIKNSTYALSSVRGFVPEACIYKKAGEVVKKR